MFIHKFLGVHSSYAMFKTKTIDDKTQVTMNEVTAQSDFMKELGGLFKYYEKYMNGEDWRYLCYTLMGFMMGGEKSTYGGDYSIMPKEFMKHFISLTKGYNLKYRGLNPIDHWEFLLPRLLTKSWPIAEFYAITRGRRIFNYNT